MYVSFCEKRCRYAKLHGVLSGKKEIFIATTARAKSLHFFLCQGLTLVNNCEKV